MRDRVGKLAFAGEVVTQQLLCSMPRKGFPANVDGGGQDSGLEDGARNGEFN